MPYLSTPPIEEKHRNPLEQVSQFIWTSVLYILYQQTDYDMKFSLFEKQILNILSCTTNNVTCPVILTSLLYVSRYNAYVKRYGPVPVGCEHKLWVTALMLADASLNDAAYATKSWAQVSGLSVTECIWMRRVFLEVIHYDLHVTEQQYGEWIEHLQRISDHVSSILYYKASLNASSLLVQPLLRQPEITPSPVYSAEQALSYSESTYTAAPYHTALYYIPPTSLPNCW